MDPLLYKKVRYHKHEWDNIPPVVPKFIINLSKYTQAFTEIHNRQSVMETTASLRSFTETRFSVSANSLTLVQDVESTVSTLDDSRKSVESDLQLYLRRTDEYA